MKSVAVVIAALLGLGAPSNPVHARRTRQGRRCVNGQDPYRFLLDTGAQGSGRADVDLVHPTLTDDEIGQTVAAIDTVMEEASH